EGCCGASPATGSLPLRAADLAPGGPIRHRVRGDPEPAREEREVVAGGPVGMSWLGRFRHFRYEIRRWVVRAQRVLDLAPSVPPCGVGTSSEPVRCGTRT